MAFVVTAGQLQSVQRSYNSYQAMGGPYLRTVALSPTLTQTYGQLWRAQPAVRMVTGFLARNVASLSLDPYRRVSATDRVKATDHPLSRLLERPMLGSKLTKYRLLSYLMHDLCIYDSAYWLKMATTRGGVGIQPIPPSMVTPLGSNILSPAGYRITGNNGHRDYDPDQLVHFHGYNPEDMREGVAPIETLRQILAEEHAATVYREQMWRNGARVAGYIKRPKDAPKWSDPARTRFKSEWQAQYAGDGPQTGGTPILEDGMEFAGSSVTPRDAQYVEARKLTREEVAVAFFVNPVMLGLMDGATIGNFAEIHKMLYQDTLPPWLTQISQDIECQLLDDLDPSSQDGSVYVEFNIKVKLAGSFEAQAGALQSAVGGPWMTRDEARAMNNLPHVDGADELIVPLNVVAGGLASPNDTAPDEPDNGPSNGQPPKAAVIAALQRRQEQTILSRLGGKADAGITEIFDLDRWNAELAADLTKAGVSGADDIARAVNAQAWTALHGALRENDRAGAVRALYAAYRTEGQTS